MRHALTAIDMWRNGVVLWSSMIETQVDMARAGFGMMDFWPGSPAGTLSDHAPHTISPASLRPEATPIDRIPHP